MTFEVGVLLPKWLTVPELLAAAELAESVGLRQLWLAEDCFAAGGLTAAALVLERTSHIHVGVGILPARARNAAFAAMEIAVLANAHPGRISIGIGHGMPDWMRQVGVEASSPLAALGETIDAIRSLLTGARVDADGRYVRLEGVQLEQPPALVPPVYAGVRGPKSLELAGAVADGTILAEPASAAYIRRAGELAAAGRKKAGGSAGPSHRVVAYNFFAAGAERDDVRSVVGAAVADVLGPTVGFQVADLSFGAELLETAPARTGGDWIPDAWLDELAVWGTVTDCVVALGGRHRAGADTCVLVVPPGADPAAVIRAAGSVVAELDAG